MCCYSFIILFSSAVQLALSAPSIFCHAVEKGSCWAIGRRTSILYLPVQPEADEIACVIVLHIAANIILINAVGCVVESPDDTCESVTPSRGDTLSGGAASDRPPAVAVPSALK